MKYLSCEIGGRRITCAEKAGKLFDVSSILVKEMKRPLDPEADSDLGALLTAGVLDVKTLAEIKRGFARDGYDAFEVDAEAARILPPVPAPSKIIAVGRNYAKHAAEREKPLPKEPIIFAKLGTALIGHQREIRLPHWVDSRIDHEVELAVIVGTKAKDLTPKRAPGAVFGYTVLNDVTARELQHSEDSEGDPWLKSKSFDTFAPMGPAVVPHGDLPDPQGLRISLLVNGEVRQDSYTSEMTFDVPTLLAFITKYFTLLPGDIVATGTPEGVGPIEPGDTVEAKIESIGTLINPVVKEPRLDRRRMAK